MADSLIACSERALLPDMPCRRLAKPQVLSRMSEQKADTALKSPILAVCLSSFIRVHRKTPKPCE